MVTEEAAEEHNPAPRITACPQRKPVPQPNLAAAAAAAYGKHPQQQQQYPQRRGPP